MRIGSRRPTRYVLVPGPVIMPGLSPSTRPTRSLGVAVVGNARSIQLTACSLSYAEVPVLNVCPSAELGRRSRPDDPALLEDVVRVRDAGERAHVLVDEQDRLATRLEAFHAAPDLGPDERRQPLGRLVEDQQSRVGHQRAADRQHLLLAARERAAEASRARRQMGKEIEDALDSPRLVAGAAIRGGRPPGFPPPGGGGYFAG